MILLLFGLLVGILIGYLIGVGKAGSKFVDDVLERVKADPQFEANAKAAIEKTLLKTLDDRKIG